MSLTAEIADARRELARELLSSTCTKTSGGTTFACYYEQTPPRID